MQTAENRSKSKPSKMQLWRKMAELIMPETSLNLIHVFLFKKKQNKTMSTVVSSGN